MKGKIGLPRILCQPEYMRIGLRLSALGIEYVYIFSGIEESNTEQPYSTHLRKEEIFWRAKEVRLGPSAHCNDLIPSRACMYSRVSN